MSAAQPAIHVRPTVRVCDGLACELAGSRALLQGLPALLDGKVPVDAVGCLGVCDQAPAAVVGGSVLPHATPESVLNKLLALSDQGAAQEAVGHLAYRAQGGYLLAAAFAEGECDAGAALAVLEHPAVQRLGSEGAPIGKLWRAARAQPAPRAIAVEVGGCGFQDRRYLEREPHRFLEGALIAAQLVGAEAITLCLPENYDDCRALLRSEIARLQASPPLPLPRIEVQAAPAPHATLKPRVETLFWLRDVLEKGGDWYARFGRRGRQGLHAISVSGRVNKPGLKLAPAGITPRELVEEYCEGMREGHSLHGCVTSSGLFAQPDLPLDPDPLRPGLPAPAAIVVLGEQDRAHADALGTMRP